MSFRSLEKLDSEFPEELMHFAQHMIYHNGISSYTSTGKIDIEFEAKLLCDILKLSDGWPGPWRGEGLKHSALYRGWVISLVYNPSGVINADEVMNGYQGISYQDFLKDFEAKKLYKGTIADLTAELIYYFSH